MKNLSTLFALFLVVSFVAVGAGNALGAGNYPEKPITLIVQSSAGGGSDIFARTLAAAIQKEKLLPQPIVVENKPGGSGGIAYAYVAGKKKDPYYILTATPSFLTTPLLGMTPVGLKDFTPIANFAFDEFMLMVGVGSKFKSLNEIVAYAKANPKKITIGGTQFGGSDSIAIYPIEKAAGVQFNYIVFNSGGEVNAALLGGHVDMASTNPGEALELYKAGKVKILGVLSEKRLAVAPEIPTMKEQGINALFVQNRGSPPRRTSRRMPARCWSRPYSNTRRPTVQEILQGQHAVRSMDGRRDLRKLARAGETPGMPPFEMNVPKRSK